MGADTDGLRNSVNMFYLTRRLRLTGRRLLQRKSRFFRPKSNTSLFGRRARFRSGVPIQGLSLAFDDGTLEEQYLQEQSLRNRLWVSAGIVLAVALLLIFYPLSHFYIEPSALARFKFVYFGDLIPALLLGLLITVLSRPARLRIWLLCAVSVACSVSLAALTLISGREGLMFQGYMSALSILFACFIGGLPYRWAAPTTLAMAAVNIGAAIHVSPLIGGGRIAIYSLGIFAALVVFVLYQWELASRQVFLSSVEAAREYATRTNWLENFSRFFRHELSNTLLGISMCVKAAQNATTIEQSEKLLTQASSRAEYMRRFLDKAANATSYSTALRAQSLVRMDLSELLERSIEMYRISWPKEQFEGEISKNVRVLGSEDGIAQMLDKLVNNAMEHTNSMGPIVVSLVAGPTHAMLTVANSGDPLSAQSHRIFEPFFSGDKKGELNMGLGLFIAREISNRHSGEIRAESTTNPRGVRIIVEIPISY
jgi:signal transduction histidine kinase